MSRQRHCLDCAAKNGFLNPSVTGFVTLSPYQNDKFIKHFAPTGMTRGLHSVFDTSHARQFCDYVVEAASSGYVETGDSRGPTLCYVATGIVGTTFKNGAFYTSSSGVRVVCIGSQATIHPYPDPTVYLATSCDTCGGPIPA